MDYRDILWFRLLELDGWRLIIGLLGKDYEVF
jgi:hypothetical protein